MQLTKMSTVNEGDEIEFLHAYSGHTIEQFWEGSALSSLGHIPLDNVRAVEQVEHEKGLLSQQKLTLRDQLSEACLPLLCHISLAHQ